MKLRTRLTLWYGVVLFVTLILATWHPYEELVLKAADHPRGDPPELEFAELVEHMMAVVIPAVVIGLIGGCWFTRRELKPLEHMMAAAEHVHENNLCERLPEIAGDGEIARLTRVFNAMLTRLDAGFQRVREFTLHASHELKTPLTILRTEAERAQERPLEGAALTEFLGSQLQEYARLTRIVEGLNLLAKADSGQVTMERQPVSVHSLMMELAGDAEILADSQKLTVRVERIDPALVLGDRGRIRQMLLILADNAVRYNGPEGFVALACEVEGGRARIIVTNSGPGITPEESAHIFERFYRGASRAAHPDGCGLGLALAQWIVTQHAGTIRVESVPDRQTRIIVEFPLLAGGRAVLEPGEPAVAQA
jgi:signal transduction histidine kinase